MIITYVILIGMFNEKNLTTEKTEKNIEEHISDIAKEFKEGFEFIKKYPKSVTIFGASRLTPASSHYYDAKKLAERIVSDTGYAIVTGGGKGIMEAANWGAKEAGGKSVGLNIHIPNIQIANNYTNDHMRFHYFFIRKTMLTYAAEAFIFFPGGFGTFDELFEILTLVQTEKIPKIPIILFGKDFWNPFRDFLRTHMFEKHHTIETGDFDLFVITDSVDIVLKAIKSEN